MCFPLHYIVPNTYKTYRDDNLYRTCERHRSKMKVSFYYKNGKLKKVLHYKNRQLDGPMMIYSMNGAIEKCVHYANGVHHGKMYVNYTEAKQFLKQTGNFHCGKQNGTFYHYSKGGSLMAIYNYCHGSKHGRQYLFHDNGTVESQQSYHYGELDGNSYFYDHNGFALLQVYYMKGKKVFENIQSMAMEECSVCFEETNFKTRCKHPVCIDCKEQVSLCPICRRHLL